MPAKSIKWFSIPLLPIASLFSFYAGSYAPLVNSTICVSAVVFVQRAVRLKEYLWAAALVAIAVAFAPLLLSFKLFLLLGITSMAACVTLMAAFRMQAAPVN